MKILFVFWFGLFAAAGAIAQTPVHFGAGEDYRIAELERKVAQLQSNIRSASANGVDIGGVSFLFGAFCALWAQNTNRGPWLWFFLGFLFSVITVIVLLVKNSNDRKLRARAQRFADERAIARASGELT